MNMRDIIEKEFFYNFWYVEHAFSEIIFYPFRWGKHSKHVARCYYYFREYNIFHEPISSNPWTFSEGTYRFDVYEFFNHDIKKINPKEENISIEKDLAKLNLTKHI